MQEGFTLARNVARNAASQAFLPRIRKPPLGARRLVPEGATAGPRRCPTLPGLVRVARGVHDVEPQHPAPYPNVPPRLAS